VRVGRSRSALQHLLFEDLGWCSPSEAFARRGVEAVAESTEVQLRDLADVDVARQPAAGAAVGVLDRAFLPGRGGIAEPAGGADLGLQDVLGNPWLRTTSPEQLKTDGVGDFITSTIGAYLLPTLSIMAISFAAYSRFQRASMLEVMGSDYVRTARAKGLANGRVIFRHAFRNALIPVTTLFSVNFGSVLAGAIITETVFNWHGMGTLLVEAVNKNDTQVMMGWLVVIATSVIIANLIADLVYGILDPRIRVG